MRTDKLTSKFQMALADAQSLALGRDHQFIEPAHLMLALLAAIAASGLAMKYLAHTDIVALKAFFLGLMAFDWQPLPADPALLVHLALVAALMIVFPVSKLLHAPGVFFSPSLNQIDDARERRHAAGWSARIVHVDRARGG